MALRAPRRNPTAIICSIEADGTASAALEARMRVRCRDPSIVQWLDVRTERLF